MSYKDTPNVTKWPGASNMLLKLLKHGNSIIIRDEDYADRWHITGGFPKEKTLWNGKKQYLFTCIFVNEIDNSFREMGGFKMSIDGLRDALKQCRQWEREDNE